MFNIKLQYEWQPHPNGAVAVDAVLFHLLYTVHTVGSLAGAARKLGVSYRHIWGLAGKWERMFGKPLIELQRGRGAHLTEFGKKLLWAEQLVQARLAPELESVRLEIERVLSQAVESTAPRLALHASHDLALAQLRDLLAQRPGFKLDLRFQGSIESLSALAKGRCSLAGFHIAEGMEESAALRFRRHLKPRQHALIGLATRTQGMMIARGNPKQIYFLADLIRPGVRFINRQPDSGSRVEFDQLLTGAGIRPDSIEGYHNEEFTHLAVAATIASGMADAGYGIKAAAARYELDFIPLLTERYYLACQRDTLREPLLTEFVAMLKSAEFRKILSGLPGYGTAITGKIYNVSEALPLARPIKSAAKAPSRELS
jgi:putative molybdopterin biosynthesis protein